MLHLAKRTFFPVPPPLPLLYADTTWRCRAMCELRGRATRQAETELIVRQNC